MQDAQGSSSLIVLQEGNEGGQGAARYDASLMPRAASRATPIAVDRVDSSRCGTSAVKARARSDASPMPRAP